MVSLKKARNAIINDMRHFTYLALTLTLLCGFSIIQAAQAGDKIAVIELFTALGCGDTMPADKAFDEVVGPGHKNLIALSCHVTFFDANIKDPHGRHFCDYRLEQYSEKVVTSLGAPQMVINGRFDTKGDKSHIVNAALTMAHSLDSIEPIQLGMNDEELNITLPEIRFDQPVDVWLFGYQKTGSLEDETVENLISSESRPFLNIATHAKKLLEWDGKYRNLNVALEEFPAEGYVVLAQYADHTDILAAGKIEKP